MDNYIVLDLETPNNRSNSICSIAVLVIKDKEIIKEHYSLINPEDRFDVRISNLHNITANMILDKPTFKNYWDNIKDLLTNNVIIGHNVTFDLNVLANTLHRYRIKIPKFEYIDTLKLAKDKLKLDSYSLTSIMNYLNYEYESHNALEDAKATYKLFEHLCKDSYVNSPSIYKWEFKLKDNIDSKLYKNINELNGIIQGIKYDGIINEREIQRLNKWVDNNIVYMQYRLFYNIINTIRGIIKDNVIDAYEKKELLNLAQSIPQSKIYNETTLNLQILYGIIDGIVCDNEIVDDEIRELNKWLKINEYLSGSYPYDKVLSIVKDISKEHIISKEKKADILINLRNIIDPPKDKMNHLNLQGKTFCLSGEFSCGNKAEMKTKIERLGAISKNGVSSKVDYLFVGGLGSEAWKFGNVGAKIAKAQELQEKGYKIKIVSEDELLKIIN